MPPKVLTQAQLEHVLRKAGWAERLVPIMSAIGMAESSGRLNAYNPGVGHGSVPTVEQSIGPWQINMHPSLKRSYDRERLGSDPFYNAKVALDIYNKQGLKAWGAYTDGRYRRYYKGKPLNPEDLDSELEMPEAPKLPPLTFDQVLPEDQLNNAYAQSTQAANLQVQKLGGRTNGAGLTPLLSQIPNVDQSPQVETPEVKLNGVGSSLAPNSIKPLPGAQKNVPAAPIAAQEPISEPVEQPLPEDFSTGIDFSAKPDNVPAREFALRALVPAIANRLHMEPVDVEKELRARGIIQLSDGIPVPDNYKGKTNFSITPDFAGAVAERAINKRKSLAGIIASGQIFDSNELSRELGIDPNEINNALTGKDDRYFDAVKEREINTVKYEQQLRRYQTSFNPDEPISTAEIRASRDMGWITPEKAELAIREEKELLRKIKDEDRDWFMMSQFSGQESPEELNQRINQYSQSKVESILSKYRDLKSYANDEEKQRQGGLNGLIDESIKTAGRYIAKIPATLMEVGAIGTSAAGAAGSVMAFGGANPTHEQFIQSLMDGAKDWRESIDNHTPFKQKEGYSNNFLVNEVSEGFSQILVQSLLAPITGGLSIGFPLAEGATAQFREAREGGASQGMQLGAAAVGAALAVPEVLLHVGYLGKLVKPGSLISKLYETTWAKVSKFFPKAEAEEIVKKSVGSFVAQGLKTGVLSGSGEYSQEAIEDLGNKFFKKITYDPKLTWKDVFVPNEQERRGYAAAGIVGIFGGNLHAAASVLSTSELKSAYNELPNMLAEGRYSQAYADKVAKVITEVLESRKINTKATPLTSNQINKSIKEQLKLDPAQKSEIASNRKQLDKFQSELSAGDVVLTPEGEGRIIHSRGKNWLIEYNPTTNSKGEVTYQSVKQFRKDKIRPVEISSNPDTDLPDFGTVEDLPANLQLEAPIDSTIQKLPDNASGNQVAHLTSPDEIFDALDFGENQVFVDKFLQKGKSKSEVLKTAFGAEALNNTPALRNRLAFLDIREQIAAETDPLKKFAMMTIPGNWNAEHSRLLDDFNRSYPFSPLVRVLKGVRPEQGKFKDAVRNLRRQGMPEAADFIQSEYDRQMQEGWGKPSSASGKISTEAPQTQENIEVSSQPASLETQTLVQDQKVEVPVAKKVEPKKVPPALIPTKVKPATVEEIHSVAKAKGVDVNSPVFQKLSKDLVGVAKLDKMSPAQLTKIQEGVKAGRFDHAKLATNAPRPKFENDAPVMTGQGKVGLVDRVDEDGKHVWVYDPDTDKTTKHLISTLKNVTDPRLLKAIDAGHSSPHDFTKFSLHKIGTGEGAQAFTWGLYFSDDTGIQRHYRRSLRRKVPKESRYKGGITYKVELAPDKHELFHLDRPLKDQSPYVKQILEENGLYSKDRENKTPTSLYNHLTQKRFKGSEKATSLYLDSIGIKGVMYAAAGFRSGSKKGAKHNYVIYNDRNISVKVKIKYLKERSYEVENLVTGEVKEFIHPDDAAIEKWLNENKNQTDIVKLIMENSTSVKTGQTLIKAYNTAIGDSGSVVLTPAEKASIVRAAQDATSQNDPSFMEHRLSYLLEKATKRAKEAEEYYGKQGEKLPAHLTDKQKLKIEKLVIGKKTEGSIKDIVEKSSGMQGVTIDSVLMRQGDALPNATTITKSLTIKSLDVSVPKLEVITKNFIMDGRGNKGTFVAPKLKKIGGKLSLVGVYFSRNKNFEINPDPISFPVLEDLGNLDTTYYPLQAFRALLKEQFGKNSPIDVAIENLERFDPSSSHGISQMNTNYAKYKKNKHNAIINILLENFEDFKKAINAPNLKTLAGQSPKTTTEPRFQKALMDMFLSKHENNKNFHEFFKGSKVVDRNGRPQIFFHGGINFKGGAFDSRETVDFGFHFGDKDQANDRTRKMGEDEYGIPFLGSELIPVVLQARKPLRLRDEGHWSNQSVFHQAVNLGVLDESQLKEIFGDKARDDGYLIRSDLSHKESEERLKRALEKAGYDSIIYTNEHEGDAFNDSYIMFRPEQIKSIYNSGDFNPKEGRFHKAAADKIDKLGADGPAAQWINRNENTIKDWNKYIKKGGPIPDNVSRIPDTYNATFGLIELAKDVEKMFKDKSSTDKMAEIATVDLNDYLKKMADDNAEVDNPEIAAAVNRYNSDPKAATEKINKLIFDNRIESLQEWKEYLTKENPVYAKDPFFRDWVWTDLIKVRATRPDLPLSLDKAALAAIYHDIKTKPNSSSFQKLYEKKVSELMLQDANTSEILKVKDGTWIKIPQTDKSDPKFRDTVAKVQAVSRKEWCTSQGMAETYIQWGDFWVLIKNEKSELAIRFESGAVAEIQGKENNGSIPEEFLPDVKDLIRSNKVELTISSMDQVLRAIKQSKFNAKKAEFIKERDKLYRKYFDPEYKAPKASKKGDPEVGELNKRINELTEKKELEVDYDQEYKKLREKYGGAVWREAISLVSNTGILPDTAHAEGDITNESLQDIKSRLKKFDWDGYALKRKDTVFRNKILEIAEQYADLRVRDLEDILKNKKSELDKELTPTKDQREKEHQEFLETTVGKYGQAKFTLAKTISDDLAGIPTTSAARDDMSQVELDKYAKNYRIHLTDANTVQTSKNTAIDLHLFESYDKENEAKLREKLKDPEYRKDINEILNLIHDEKLRELEYQFNSKKAELNKELIDKTEVESLSERLLPDSELYKYLEMELPKGTKDWDEAKKRMTDFAGEYYLGSDAWSQEIEDVMYDDLVDELKDRIQKFDPEKYRKQVKEELDRELDDDTELVKHWKSYLSGEIKPDTLHFLRDHYNTNEDGKYHTNSPYDIANLAIMDGEPTSPLLVLSRNYNLEHWTPARLSKEFDDRATKDSVSRAIRNSYQEVSPALIKTVQSVIERIKNDVIPIFEKDFEAKKAELDRELENDNEPLTFPLTLGPEFTDNFEKIYKETGSGESALRAAVKDFIDKFNSKEKAIEEFSKFTSQDEVDMHVLHDLEEEIYDRAIENLSFNLRPEEKQQLMKSAFNIAGELEEWYINNWEQMESELRGEIDQEINGEDRFNRAAYTYNELEALKSEKLNDKFIAKVSFKVDKDGNIEVSPAAAELIRRAEMAYTGVDSDPFLAGMLRSDQLGKYIPVLKGVIAKAPKEYSKATLKPLKDLINQLGVAYTKKSAIIYIDPKKLPHEMVHKLRYEFSGYQERVGDYYNSFSKLFDSLKDLEKSAFDNYLGRSYFNNKSFNQLNTLDKEFLHEEIIAHTLDGDYGKLGLSDAQAAKIISADIEAYLEKNGDGIIAKLQEWIDESQKQSVRNTKKRKGVSKTDTGTQSRRGEGRTGGAKTAETKEGPDREGDGNPPGVGTEINSEKPRAYPINAEAHTELNPEDLEFDSRFYTPITRGGMHDIASQWLEERGISNAINELYDLPVNALTVAKRQAVLSYLDAQIHHYMQQGNEARARAIYESMVGIVNTVSPEYTEWGQAISQLAHWNSLGPEAIVNIVENKRYKRGKARGTLELKVQEDLRNQSTEIENITKEIDALEAAIKSNSRHIWQGLLKETQKLRTNTLDILKEHFGDLKTSNDRLLKAIETLHGTQRVFADLWYKENLISSNDGIAYGWGIYSSQSEGVANHYRNPDNNTRVPATYKGHSLETLFILGLGPDQDGNAHENWREYSAAYTIAHALQFGDSFEEIQKFWINESQSGIKYEYQRIGELEDHINFLKSKELEVLSNNIRDRISDIEDEIDRAKQRIARYSEEVQEYKKLKSKDFVREQLPGAIYRNKIHKEEEEFLRWDLPYDKQSEFIKTRLNEWLSETDSQLKTLSVEAKSASSPNKIEYFGELIQRAITIKKAITEFINAKEGTAGSLGGYFYNSLPNKPNSENHVDRARDKSKLLLSRGIVGNSYLIAKDRGKTNGKLNFVNFSAEHIEIVEMLRAAVDNRKDINELNVPVKDALMQVGKEKYLEGKVAGGQTLNEWKSSVMNKISDNGGNPASVAPYLDSLYVAVRENAKSEYRAKELERVKKKYGYVDDTAALEKLSQLKAELAKRIHIEAQNLREAKGIKPKKTLLEQALDNEFSDLTGDALEDAKNDVRMVRDKNAFYTHWNKKGLSAKEITKRYIEAVDHFINIDAELKEGRKTRKIEKDLGKNLSDLTTEEIEEYEKKIHALKKIRNKKLSDFRATVKHLVDRPETPKKRVSDWYLRVNRAGETMLTSSLATVSHNIIAQRVVKFLHTVETAGELALLKLERQFNLNKFTKDPTDINIATSFTDMFLQELQSSFAPAVQHAYNEYKKNKTGLITTLSLIVAHKQRVVEGVLAHNPDLYEDMYAKYSYGEDVLHKFPIDKTYTKTQATIEKVVRGVESWTHFWTTLNRLQENHFKSATFLGILTVELKARGLDPDQVILHGKIDGLDRGILEKAVARAAEDTFSQDIPKTSEFYRTVNTLSNAAKWIPFPLNPLLFRRFLFNSVSYLVEHTPLVLAKAAGPGVTARDMSKCLVGMGIFTFAIGLLSAFGSDDDDPLVLSIGGKSFKMTAYNPLSSFLILASIVTRAAKGKKPLKAVDEIWKLFGIDTRYPNLALEWFESIADLVSSEEDKKYVKAGELSKQVVGRGISAYFKAFATLKAIHASFDNEEATIRDYGDEPFLAELKKTFPISEATTKLLTGKSSKIREDALTGEPMLKVNPWLDQLGVTVVPEKQIGPKYTAAEEYLDVELSKMRQKNVKFYKTPEQRTASGIVSQLYTALDKGISPETVINRANTYYSKGEISEYQLKNITTTAYIPTKLGRKAIDAPIPMLVRAAKYATKDELNIIKTILEVKAVNQADKNTLTPEELELLRIIFPKL